MVENEHLIEFYGTECKFCIEMQPLVEQLEREEGIKINRYEVWHNADNEKKRKELDKDRCGGVPFFINTKTGKWICGGASYDKLKEWALGE